MIIRICRGAVLAATVLLNACGAVLYDDIEEKLPISPVACYFSFASTYVSEGVVSIASASAEQQQFSLQLQVAEAGPELLISTEDGRALQSISCPGTDFDIRPVPGSLDIELPIPTSRLLVYLQLMRMPEEKIDQTLRPGWQYKPSANGRVFYQLDESRGSGREIRIRFTRSGPYNDSAELKDSRYPESVTLVVTARRGQ